MKKKECVAIILAGGRGERLGALTYNTAKPLVVFGGKYRIIDFTLSNCIDSGIDTIGVLTQYFPTKFNNYIKNSRFWNLGQKNGGIFLRPSNKLAGSYAGTADAVYQNISFIEQFSPENVLVLSGDHVYKMDYQPMLDFHITNNADITIASTTVALEDAPRFGVLKADEDGTVTSFEEKPTSPQSTLVSTGVYIFKWSKLKEYLVFDNLSAISEKDFGKNVIPTMLKQNEKIFTYKFDGYWKDVGNLYSLWQSNMDFLDQSSLLNIDSSFFQSYPPNSFESSYSISNSGSIKKAIISGGCNIYGCVENSILSSSVEIGAGCEITDSIIMPNAIIGNNVKIHKAIIGSYAVIMDGVEIGTDCGMDMFVDNNFCTNDISVVAPHAYISKNLKFKSNSHINQTYVKELAGYTFV